MLAWWKLNAGHGAIAGDSTGHEHPVALSKGQSLGCAPSSAPDGYRCALRLNGRGDAQTRPALLPVVDTGFGYSVSAWVNLGRCTGTCIALSQDGTKVSMFTLGYQAKCTLDKQGCSVFAVRVADDPTTTPLVALAAVGSQAPFGKWAQLTRMLDSTIGRATLYVNGVRKAQDSAGVVPPQSNGVLRLGAGFGGTDRWTGRLSNVCLSSTPLRQPM